MYGAAMAPSSSSKRRPIGLTALRGFEAAARRLSFTDAAAELNLTQSSISRQIATLAMDPGDDVEGEERLAMTGDFTGDGVIDLDEFKSIAVKLKTMAD